MPRHVSKLTRRSWQKNWREKHPLLDAWHHHLDKAKSRGIALDWDLEEFAQWCCLTGFLVLREGDATIDRQDATRGYSFGNCQILSHQANCIKGRREQLNGTCYKH